jgi:hypothetical protein
LEKSWVVWKAECDDQKERVGELVIDSCSYKGKDRGSRTALSRTGGAKPLRAWHLRTECVGGEKSVHGKSPNTLAYRDCGKDLVEARKADVPDARPSWCLVVKASFLYRRRIQEVREIALRCTEVQCLACDPQGWKGVLDDHENHLIRQA